MPAVFRSLAAKAASAGSYSGFEPDACLVNRYAPGAKMGLHQDKDEDDFDQPIVSVSLGTPAMFQFGGARRSDRPQRVPLSMVMLWSGAARRGSATMAC